MVSRECSTSAAPLTLNIQNDRSLQERETTRPAPRTPFPAMDFVFTPEQEEFRKTVRAFAEEVIEPRAEERKSCWGR